MTESIKALMALAAEFPQRKHVSFENDADRAFIRDVLKAVARTHVDMADPKNWGVTPEQLAQATKAVECAMPNGKEIASDIAKFLRARAELERAKTEGSMLAAFALEDAAKDIELDYGLVPQDGPLRDRAGQRCDHKFVDSDCCIKCGWKPTTQPPSPAGSANPSSDALRGQSQESSNRIQGGYSAQPGLVPDTATAPGQKSDTSGTSTPLPAKLVAARKAAAKRKTPSRKAPTRTPAGKDASAPPAPPAATGGNDEA